MHGSEWIVIFFVRNWILRFCLGYILVANGILTNLEIKTFKLNFSDLWNNRFSCNSDCGLFCNESREHFISLVFDPNRVKSLRLKCALIFGINRCSPLYMILQYSQIPSSYVQAGIFTLLALYMLKEKLQGKNKSIFLGALLLIFIPILKIFFKNFSLNVLGFTLNLSQISAVLCGVAIFHISNFGGKGKIKFSWKFLNIFFSSKKNKILFFPCQK